MTIPKFVPLSGFREYSKEEMKKRAADFADNASRRRTVRHYSTRSVPRGVIESCIRAAGSAPSGANKQPWHFVVVASPDIKKQIRDAAEAEEHEFYARRAPKEWLEVLKPLGTGENKPFLETAPYLIVIFEERYVIAADGKRTKNYYTQESVGLATGILITALHNAGLATLTHTPSPMGFLNDVLDRPSNERPFLILVVGYPAEDAVVTSTSRKPLDDNVTFV
ncbi:MAG: nitroreductase family protein [bacterium]|nr:nitroreductase family protein [bacterium]